VLLAAKVHPAADFDADELAEAMDKIDSRLHAELPEIGEVFIDVTAHGGRDRQDSNRGD
jgi:predicted HAD superfamily phosphohydrolase